MHCDLRPNNLGYMNLVHPRAVIFDFDSATQKDTSRDHFHARQKLPHRRTGTIMERYDLHPMESVALLAKRQAGEMEKEYVQR